MSDEIKVGTTVEAVMLYESGRRWGDCQHPRYTVTTMSTGGYTTLNCQTCGRDAGTGMIKDQARFRVISAPSPRSPEVREVPKVATGQRYRQKNPNGDFVVELISPSPTGRTWRARVIESSNPAYSAGDVGGWANFENVGDSRCTWTLLPSSPAEAKGMEEACRGCDADGSGYQLDHTCKPAPQPPKSLDVTTLPCVIQPSWKQDRERTDGAVVLRHTELNNDLWADRHKDRIKAALASLTGNLLTERVPSRNWER